MSEYEAFGLNESGGARMGIIKRTNEITGNVAEFSTDMQYRYSLLRWINQKENPRTVVFCGLNPSTADENDPDNTVTRCTNYAKDWGFDAYWMLNLFAYRETDRLLMKKHHSPIGWHNDEVIARVAADADLFVCAWGADGGHLQRDKSVLQLLEDIDLYCLKVTKGGHPIHPLYQRADLKPVVFRASQLVQAYPQSPIPEPK